MGSNGMRNVESRLTAAERKLGKAGMVEIEYMYYNTEPHEVFEMDLLEAVKLFTQGKIFTIRRKLTPHERVERHSGIIREIEAYVHGVDLNDLESDRQ